MSEYIERANALQYYQLICRGIACEDCRFHEYNHCKIELFLANLPAADVVERKQGQWEYIEAEELEDCVIDKIRCSCCGHEFANAIFTFESYIELIYDYCPHCGADVRGHAKTEVEE